MNVQWKLVITRLGYFALAAILGKLTQSGIPRSEKDLLAYAAAGLGAVLTAAPSALAAAGIIRPASPGVLSLAQKAGQWLTDLVNAPKAARQKELQEELRSLIQDGLQEATPGLVEAVLNKTGAYAKATSGQGLTEIPASTAKTVQEASQELQQALGVAEEAKAGAGAVQGAQTTIVAPTVDPDAAVQFNGGTQ